MIEVNSKQASRDIARISKHLDNLAPALQDAIVDAVTPYIKSELMLYDPKRYVTRKAAYGRTFQTRKQQRWFFWALESGLISVPYKRTMEMKRAWRIEGKGRTSTVVNDTDAAYYTMDNKGQSRHETLVGWRTISQRLHFARAETVKKAQEAAREVTLAFNRGDDPRTATRG